MASPIGTLCDKLAVARDKWNRPRRYHSVENGIYRKEVAYRSRSEFIGEAIIAKRYRRRQ